MKNTTKIYRGKIILLKVIVVEDEILSLQLFCNLLKKTGRVDVIGGYINPIKAREDIFRLRPDAVFLDIEMPEINGLKIAKEMSTSDLESEIIFITTYNEYALEAFKVNALDYLLKPISGTEIDRTLGRIEKRVSGKNGKISKTSSVKVTTLGGYEVYINDQKNPVRWYTGKCGEIFAYLIFMKPLEGVSKWKLVDLLWPHKDVEKGEVNLRSTISRLNKTLKEYGTDISVTSKSNHYFLKAGNIITDASKLKDLAHRTTAIDNTTLLEYEACLASYKGHLFEGCDFGWSEDLVVTYERYFSVSIKFLSEYYMKQKQSPLLALNTVELWLKFEPYNEEAQYMALILQYKVGGELAKEKFFEKLRRMYSSDLGIKPGTKLIELNNRLK